MVTDVESPAVVGNTVVPIPPHDPLATLLVSRANPVELATLVLDSPALQALRASGIVLVVPLVADGRLLGTINLGPRRSEQDYTADDRALLATLASQLAPAVRLASLARRQEEQAAERERIDQELRVARIIQQTLLPRNLPDLRGWTVDAFYRPAREVGGDFYDVIPLPDGRVVVVEGDVTDKGIPAALVMATCRAALRAATEHAQDPGEILRRANEALVEDIPPTMFVTCFCAVVDPSGGVVHFANAGHPLPVLVADGVGSALRATGMPLGMLPGSAYEVVTATIPQGAMLVIVSDGVAEAHAPDGSMYGFDRVARIAAESKDPVAAIVADVDAYSPGMQEDDITIVVLTRRVSAENSAQAFSTGLLELSVQSLPGVERQVMDQVMAVAGDAGMVPERTRRLGTAVAEAVMNAVEHGNAFDAERSVDVVVVDDSDSVLVEVFDHGAGASGPVEVPDLDAKLAGEQSPRGWGRYLIEQLVDHFDDRIVDGRHVVSLRMMKEEPWPST